ncbi:unnamed protein product [Orchesella dallaii]|uniref:Carrier domain-containing protein n=1 Tax=Orchesella dallaii TaxID=48710 RepID=A0ABP1RJA1_9HEXA
MAKELYNTSPVFRMHFEYCEKILKNEYNISIADILWSHATNEISRTIYSQTSIFCVEYALLKLWESLGVKPDFVVGHSLGEFGAAVCAGILTVEDAIKLVAERSRLIDLLPHGKMLVIKADKQSVDSMIRKFGKSLDYAAINSSEQTVVAGNTVEVLQFLEFCNEAKVKCILLEATHAFHSKHMDGMLNDYRNIANTVEIMKGNSCQYISGMQGCVVDVATLDAEYWVQHTREKVLFMKASKCAVECGCKTFIEVGPQPILSALTMLNNDIPLLCLPSLKRKANDWETLLESVGKLYLKGNKIDWKRLDDFCLRKKVRLPTYPFIGKTHWPESLVDTSVTIHPLVGSVISNASANKLFQSSLSLKALEYVKDHAIGENVIYPGACYLEMCLAAGLATVEGSMDWLSPPTRPMKVENLIIQAPLCLEEGKICQLQTVVELNTSNDGDGDWNDMKVNIFRKLESDSIKWLPHARAHFSPIASAEEKDVGFDTERFKTTLQLPATEDEVTDVYNKLASIGLKFGPTFRSIQKVWRRDNSTSLLAKVNVPQSEERDTPYIIHPVVLDAMIQAIMMLLVTSNLKKKLYVPIKIGKLVWISNINTDEDVYIHVFVPGGEQSGTASAKSVLIDSKGSTLAIMSGVELIDTTIKAIESILEQQISSLPDMYEEVWKSTIGPRQYLTCIEKTGGKFYTDEFKLKNDDLIQNQPSYILELFRDLETFVYLHMLKAMYKCGWVPQEPSEIFYEDTLNKALGIQSKHNEYFGFMLEVLRQEGLLENLPMNSSTKMCWKVKKSPPNIEEVDQILESPFAANLHAKFKSTLLFGKIGEALSSILRGEQSALGILFPPEKNEYPSAADFYVEYADTYKVQVVVSEVSKRWMEYVKENINVNECVIRVLEVGAGTGALTGTLMKNFEMLGMQYEYTYTDISAAFFAAAEKKFENHSKHIKFKKLNIEEDPLDQGFMPEYFDFVFASDVIHATKDIRQSLHNIRMLMKPHAKLDILEMTQVLRVGTYSFGLLDGFWKFEDRELRPRHCTLSKQAWERVLVDAGFQVNGIFSTVNDNHSYICSERTLSPLRESMPVGVSIRPKNWLIFHLDSNPVSNFIRSKIKSTTTRNVIMVTECGKYDEVNSQENDNEILFKIRRDNEMDFAKTFQSIQQRKLDIEGIVYCWALDKSKTSQKQILEPYFYLSKALLGSKQNILPRFYALTSGVVPLEDNDLSHFHSSTIWGFLKAMTSENPGIYGRCIEVADSRWDELRLHEVYYEIWNLDMNNMTAFQGNCRFIPKLQPHNPINNALKLPKGSDRFQLILPETKVITDLQFGLLEPITLKGDEVEIQVKASALNFRDVLSIIKPSDDFKDVNTVGFDFSGIIKRVGNQVQKWKVGDRVCGCNVHFTAMPSHLNLPEDLLLCLPDDLSYAEGATMPAVYTTSVLCLIQKAEIKSDDIVLIHTASGGVGLSAIEICKYVGCQIIVTAGSKRKQNYLRSLGVQHVFHSRNTLYGNQILELTNGRGVDVVLNSLTSEGFKEATLHACAKGARFIEMSKLNVWTKKEVKQRRPDVVYIEVDLSQSDKRTWIRLLNDLTPLLEMKVVKPIPHIRFDALNVREALHYMQKAKHIGKVVCTLPDFKTENGELKVNTPMFNKESTYLITGGLGGIGFAVCNWMLEKGAKHIVLAGRSLPSESIEIKIKEINLLGAKVIPVQLDVSSLQQCKELIEDKIIKLGLPPLKGILHAAGTLADGLIVNHDWPSMSSTFKAKIDGTINLHKLTKHLNLEHFVLFSSMASIFGTPGQCNHSAANTFEDAFAHFRHSIGLPATSINYGQWGEVGVATELDLPGIWPLSNLQGIKGLEYAIQSHRTQTAVLNVTSFVMMSKFYPHLSAYLDERFWKKCASGSGGSMTIKSDEFWQQYDSVSENDGKVEILKVQLRNIIRFILKLDEHETIGDDVNLQDLGVDSLMFVEIKNGLQTLLGERITVNASSLKDCNNIGHIANTLVTLIEGSHLQEETAIRPTMDEVVALIREDCELPHHITAKVEQIPVCITEVRSVLVTGCSGNFGPYILKELSSLAQITEIVCIMRPVNNLSPYDRLKKTLEKLELLPNIALEKVRCVIGNVAEPFLGMNLTVWEELSENVDAVFHCAASVQHTEQYKATSKGSMRTVNIGGTKNVLEFACAKKLKLVYYASSLLGVATLDDGRISERWPEMDEFNGKTTFAYPITKFIGDILMKQGVERGIPCKSFRFPLIVGESKTGRCIVENNHYLIRYMFILKYGIMPSTPVFIPMLPVDICAGTSIKLFFQKNEASGVYNISHRHPSADQEFLVIANRLGYTVEIVEFSEFARRIEESEGPAGAALKLFNDVYSSEESIMSTYYNTPVLRHWIENSSISNDFFQSNKVLCYDPDFYKTQKDTMEYVYKDMIFCKENGWFKKFGLLT